MSTQTVNFAGANLNWALNGADSHFPALLADFVGMR